MHVVTANEMYEIDRFTSEEIGLSGVLLMENAGRAVAAKMVDLLKGNEKVAVLVGTGNNGGDGFVIARSLLNIGYEVDVFLLSDRQKIEGDAAYHLNVFERLGYQLHRLDEYSVLAKYSVIVDTMLGIGVKGELRSPYKEVIAVCNQLESFKIAVDIPTGVYADGGHAADVFQASVTITIQCPKLSAFTYPAAAFYGRLEVVDVGIPEKVIRSLAHPRTLWGKNEVKATIINRSAYSHKGSYGKCLIIGGSKGMSGAPIMSAKAAHRSGAGLVTIAIPEDIHMIVASQTLEATFLPFNTATDQLLSFDLSHFDAVAIGPGMGRDEHACRIVESVLKSFCGPVIVDADALYHLATIKEVLNKRESPTILTPHSGEMARLTGRSVSNIGNDRFCVSSLFAESYRCFVVLKGPNTIVTAPTGEQIVHQSGNAALAKGGSGDVLTGIITAFVMHQKEVLSSLNNAIYFHGKAAESLVESSHSMIDVLASDIIGELPRVFRTIFK